MKTLDRPLDDDDRAMADLADVRDWRRIGGPHTGETGPIPVRKLIRRVKSGTSWKPWPVNRKTVIDDQLDGWGFLTRRKTELAVYDDQILPHSPFSGWVAFAIEPWDVDAAAAGLDEHWPAKFDLARRHWEIRRTSEPKAPRTSSMSGHPVRARTAATWRSGTHRAQRSTCTATNRADLATLVDGGARVRDGRTLDDTLSDDDPVPDAAGRTIYRIVQEGITNARKHAPGSALAIELAGSPDDGIDVTLRNPLGFGAAVPGSGLGLVGLAERAELRGGRLEHGRDGAAFVLHGWIPWAA